jgi:osmotically-inducible protein OsmY
MKTLIATLLATAAGASFAAAPTAALNHDPATYRNVTQKVAADYKSAVAKCNGMGGNDKEVCTAEAQAARVHAEADALAKYNSTAEGRTKAATRIAEADYALAKARCGGRSGADKDDCMNGAKSAHAAALADAKAGRATTAAMGTSGMAGTTTSTTTTTTAGVGKTAMDKCAQAGGSARTGCLVETKGSVAKEVAADAANHTENVAANAAARTENAAANAADKTRVATATAAEKTKEVVHNGWEKTKDAAATVAQKTGNALERAGDKTRQVASTAAQKTENAMDRAGEATRDTAATAADKTAHATDKTRVAASDTTITTKVKADLAAEPDLKSLGIHVETEKGVVMLSGFVDSKAEAAKAVKVAKGVEGVSTVKSAIKVK